MAFESARNPQKRADELDAELAEEGHGRGPQPAGGEDRVHVCHRPASGHQLDSGIP